MKDLERISTALYVTKELQDPECEARARRITELKPHISCGEAEEAVRFVDEMLAEAEPVIRNVAGGAA